MTTNEMKSYLGNYRKLKSRANRLIRELELFPEDKSFLEPLLRSITDTAEDISGKIAAVENPAYRELLFRKYINGETLDGLGEELCYSPRHVQRLLNTAVASMTEVTPHGRE